MIFLIILIIRCQGGLCLPGAAHVSCEGRVAACAGGRVPGAPLAQLAVHAAWHVAP